MESKERINGKPDRMVGVVRFPEDVQREGYRALLQATEQLVYPRSDPSEVPSGDHPQPSRRVFIFETTADQIEKMHEHPALNGLAYEFVVYTPPVPEEQRASLQWQSRPVA